VKERSIEDGGGIELFAGDRGSDNRKDSGPDDGPDAKRCERPGAQRFFQTMLREFGIADEFVDRFSGEELM
jgi:hypothetical protein